MSELLPCPFCGGEVEHQLMWDGAYSFTCRQCGLNARFTDDIARAVPEMIEGTEKKWNTRYERTCTYEPSYEDPEIRIFRCSNCGCGMHYRTLYCPGCGAKVVDE